MEIARGEIWWVELPEPVESSPGGRRPVLVIQANAYNRSRISTVLAAVVTSNVRLAEMPGNLLLQARESGLRRPSVVNVSQIVTADRSFLRSRAGRLRPESMARVDQGLRLLLNLG
ncbi:MAG: type II toxin-antitoxin system PemK/MazF family toxin [Acidobacteriota bacterium]